MVGHQGQAPVALPGGPVNPPVARFEMLGRRVEDEQRQPLPRPSHRHVTEPFAHRLDPPQIMVFAQQILKATVLASFQQTHFNFIQDHLWLQCRQGLCLTHAGQCKKFRGACPDKSAFSLSIGAFPAVTAWPWSCEP
jgi:hypothetical protein